MKNNKIKKIFGRTLSVILTIFLLVGAIPIAEVSAAENTDQFKYILLDDGTIEVTRYIGNDINVVIPEEIDGKIVTKIDAFCFRNDNRYNIKYITISKNINGFTYSFNGGKCEESGCLQELINLESIVVDKNNQTYASESGILFNKELTKLMYYPNHKSDEEYVVKSSVSELGRSSLSYNIFLKRLKFESYLTFIDEDAITNCKVEEAEYPIYLDNPSYLSLYTFCDNLKKVYISKEVEHMNDEDFMGSPNVVLYVFDNSYGLDWAKEHDVPYVIVHESETTIPKPTATEPIETTVPEPTATEPIETTVPVPTVTEQVETTVPEPTATEPIETTVPEPTATEPIETTVPEPTVTEPIETTVPEPTVTEPIETTVPEPTVTEPIETTVPEPTATEPIETTVPEPTVTEQVETTVASPETTVESATDKVEPTKSVATPDTPNNNSNSGSSSGSSSASINNSSIVATGDMLGASNLLLLSIIIMSATTGVSVILFRRKKEKVSNK